MAVVGPHFLEAVPVVVSQTRGPHWLPGGFPDQNGDTGPSTHRGFGWVAVSFAALSAQAAGRPMDRSKVTIRALPKVKSGGEGAVPGYPQARPHTCVFNPSVRHGQSCKLDGGFTPVAHSGRWGREGELHWCPPKKTHFFQDEDVFLAMGGPAIVSG